jgi:hypothetical protein
MIMSALCRFCCRNRHTDGAERLVHFLKPSINHPPDCAGDLRWTLLTRATLTQRTKGRTVVAGRPTWQACVLCNRCQRELELGTAWPAQSQPSEPQDTLQVRKQHFDTFPVAG